MASSKGGAHPWFTGERVEYLLVHRQVRRGKEDRWSLVSGKVVPSDLVDDVGIAERWGAGYYRVQARGAGGRIIGAAYHVGIPNTEGVVPVLSDDGGAEGLQASSASGDANVNQLLLDFMKLQQAQFSAEIRRVQEANEANLEAFAKINQATIESLGGVRERTQDDSRINTILEKLDKVSEANTRLQIEAAELRAKRRAGDDDVWPDILKAVVPKVMELASRPRAAPRGAQVVEQVRQVQRRGAARPVEAPPVEAPPEAPPVEAPPEAPPVEGEVVEAPPALTDAERVERLKVLGWELPPLERVVEYVEARAISPEQLKWFRVLRDADLLPSAYRRALVSAL